MKTSVVILTKNSAATVEETLRSLVPYYEQGFVQEIIVVDGYSTDGTLDVVARYPVRLLFEDKKHPFPAAAREMGWRNARGELVMYLDSDGYIGEGFFPRAYEFFEESDVGLVGCEEHTVVTNALTRANAEERAFAYRVHRPSPSPFFRVYRWLQGIPRGIFVGGACHIVRRSCLEAVGGFPLSDCGEDIPLAEKIVAAGWRNLWWLGAPVYHRLPSTFKGLLKQHYRHGRQQAVWEMTMKQESRAKLLADWHHVLLIASRLASPLIGVALAVYFRNLRHLLIYPLCRYAGLAGYFRAFLSRSKRPGDRR